MLTNEQGAKQKWCHMTLGANRSKCLASECSAWRWAEFTPHVYEPYDQQAPEGKEIPEERRGFCGIAGMPKF
jgi:hypothetical protein